MRTEFAKLYFIEAEGDFQVLLTKEEDPERDLFQIRFRTELEFYNEEKTLDFENETQRDIAFKNTTLQEAIDFYYEVLKNYQSVPKIHSFILR